MKRTRIAILSLLVLFSACAEKNTFVPERENNTLSFTVDVQVRNGITGMVIMKTNPEVNITVTSGEDVDYEINYALDGQSAAEKESHVWLGEPRRLPIEVDPAVMKHTVTGTVSRSDGQGEPQEFSCEFDVFAAEVTAIKDVTFASSSFLGFASTSETGVFGVPALDEGILSFTLEPASAAQVALSGAVEFDMEHYTCDPEGHVTVPYVVKQSGVVSIVADWGEGKYVKNINIAYYPTIYFHPDDVSVTCSIVKPKLLAPYEITTNLSYNLICDWTNVDKINISRVTTKVSKGDNIVTNPGIQPLSVSGEGEETVMKFSADTARMVSNYHFANYYSSGQDLEVTGILYISLLFDAAEEVSPCFWKMTSATSKIPRGDAAHLAGNTSYPNYKPEWGEMNVPWTYTAETEANLLQRHIAGEDITPYIIK